MLPGSRTVNLRQHVAGAPLKRGFTKGFVYSDGWVDDARLVVFIAVLGMGYSWSLGFRDDRRRAS